MHWNMLAAGRASLWTDGCGGMGDWVYDAEPGCGSQDRVNTAACGHEPSILLSSGCSLAPTLSDSHPLRFVCIR